MRRFGRRRSSEALSRRSAAGNVRTLPPLATLLALTAFGAFGMVAAACVDGVTPDCSDAATPCGPDNDASGDVRPDAGDEV